MAGPRLMWRVTYGSPCQIDGDTVLDVTARGVRLMNGSWQPRKSRTQSWHDTEAEARCARMEWLRERWEALQFAEREAHRALLDAMEGC